MIQVRNRRPWAVELPAAGVVVEAGGVVDVDDDLGAQLLAQPTNWEPAGTRRAKPAAKKAAKKAPPRARQRSASFEAPTTAEEA